MAALEMSVASFAGTNCVTAKIASLDVVKKAHQLRGLALPAEKSILSEIDVLLGPAFRKFCEACERQDTRDVIKRAPDVREISLKYSSATGVKTNSTLWHLTVSNIGKHCLGLVDEGTVKSRAATIPALGLATKLVKTDLTRVNSQRGILHASFEQGRRSGLKC